jgi:hypothetical protein
MKGKVMNFILSKSKVSKSFKMCIILISIIFLFLNLTGCTLSRQFIRTHTGHSYGSNFDNNTYSDSWDVFEPSASTSQWVSDDGFDFTQQSAGSVDVSSDVVIHPGTDPRHTGVKTYPTPLWPRGIYTTGTGIIVILDIYR